MHMKMVKIGEDKSSGAPAKLRLVRSKEKMSGILFRNQYENLNSGLAGRRSRNGGRRHTYVQRIVTFTYSSSPLILLPPPPPPPPHAALAPSPFYIHPPAGHRIGKGIPRGSTFKERVENKHSTVTAPWHPDPPAAISTNK